jgi:hypothetical protein
MAEVTRCDACLAETPSDQLRGWLGIRHYAPARWDNTNSPDGSCVDYDACSPGCARVIVDMTVLEAGDAS